MIKGINNANEFLTVAGIEILDDDTNSVDEVKSMIDGYLQNKEFEDIKNRLDNITSDGVITVSEKTLLKIEWGNIKTAYDKVYSLFSSNAELNENFYFTELVKKFNVLSTLITKVLEDMNSDYIGDDAKQIDEMFYDCWFYINGCSEIYDKSNKDLNRYGLDFIGDTELNTTTELTVKPYLAYDRGVVVPYNATDFSWYRTVDNKLIKANSNVCTIQASDIISGNSEKFYCKWTFKTTDSDKSYNTTVGGFIDISFKTITQYQQNTYENEIELDKSDKAWVDEQPKQEAYKFVWSRVSDDNGKTWNYFRITGSTGFQGATGDRGPAGLNGWSQATIQLFMRSAEKPTARPLQLKYTFKTGALSSGVEGVPLVECLNGWLTAVPSGSEPLYVIHASAFNDTAVDPIDPNDWTPAEILSENGTKGENGFAVANVVLYKRSTEIPATPTTDCTYNFYIGTIEGSDIGEGKWSKVFPPDDGQPLWVTNATASTRIKKDKETDDITNDTDVITPQEWSTPQIIVKDGAKGDKGDKGEKGDTGSTGPKGDDGLKGDKGDKGEDGKDAITTYIDVSSYIFPALDNGIISPLEYEKFKSTVMVVQGEYRLTAINSSEALANNQFYLSASGNGITNLSIEKSMVRATKESVMIYNTASIDVTIHYRDVNGKTGTIDYKISLAKAIKGKQGITGDKGVGVKAIITYYGLSTSNTTAPTEWQSTSVPTMTVTNKYLWSYQRIEYTDSTFLETGKIVTGVYGETGATGNGIASIAYYYAVSSTQVAPSTITSTTIPTMSSTDKYLWQKTVINFTNGTNKTEVALIGVYGETGKTGLTGQYTAFQYYASTSSTEQVGGSWSSTMPSIAGGKFLWMRTQVVPAGGTLGSNWSTPTLAGSDISKLMATIETVDGKVKQNTASINANANAIATKVTQQEVDKSISDIQIGGRNLIRGTADQRSGDCGVFKYDNSYYNNDIKYGKADTFKSPRPWLCCFYDFYSLYKRENLKVGDVVTFSIRVLANFTPKTAVNMTLYRIGSTQDGQNDVNITLGNKTLEPNKWYTYSATWAITQANLDIVQGNASNNNYPRAEVDYYDPDIYAEHNICIFGEGNYIYIGGMKLEKGNIATDWTPAPEDLEQEINDNKTKLTEHETLIQQNADNIKLMVKKTDYATDQQGVTNKLNEQQSQIDLNTTAITSKVSQTDYAKDKGVIESSIQQTANSIALKVSEDGKVKTKAGIEVGTVDGQGYILLDADKIIATGTITGEKIQANAIEVRHINTDSLYSEEIKVGNRIVSGAYATDPTNPNKEPGFYADKDGRVAMVDAEIIGTIDSDALTTVNAIPNINSSVIKSEYKAYWDNADAVEFEDWIRVDFSQSFYAISMCYGNGKYVACDSSFDYIYSSNGNTWTKRYITDSHPRDEGTNAVFYGNGKFIILGEKIYYSSDAISWTQASGDINYPGSMAVGNGYVSGCYGNGKYIAMGHDGKIAYSTDGINWARASATIGTYPILTFGNGKFVAIANNKTYQSTDGLTWTPVSLPSFASGFSVQKIVYFMARFIAFGFLNQKGGGLYSTDGINWKELGDMKFGSNKVTGIASNGNYLIAVGVNMKASYSLDAGLTWTAINNFHYDIAKDIVYGGNHKFVVMGSGAGVYYKHEYNFKKISRFFSNIKPKLDTSKVVIPSTEPLMHEKKVLRGTTTNQSGSPVNIVTMRVSDSELYIKTNSKTFLFSDSNPLTWDLRIKNLELSKINATTEIGDTFPKTNDTKLGSEDRPFADMYSNKFTGNVNVQNTPYRVWGAVAN